MKFALKLKGLLCLPIFRYIPFVPLESRWQAVSCVIDQNNVREAEIAPSLRNKTQWHEQTTNEILQMEHNSAPFRCRNKSIELKISHLPSVIFLFMGVAISMAGCNTNTILPPIPTNADPATYISPTFEIVPSSALLFENHLKPKGIPLLDWNNIPVMPQAIAGEEYQDGSYSYAINKSMEEVQAFYIQELIPRGWKPFNGEFERKGDGAVGIFEKDVTIINITISPDPDNGDVVVVILHKN